MSDEEPLSSSKRPGASRPPLSRVELRHPPGDYYRSVALGTLFPGLGLLSTRWRNLGRALVLVSLVVLGFALARLWRGGVLRSALEASVRPEVLQWVGLGILVGAVLWVGSIVLTAEQTWPRRRPTGRVARVAFAAVACLVIAAPAALAVQLLDVQAELIDDTFASETDDYVNGLSGGTKKDPWAGTPRVNTLLIGSDAGKDRIGVRTDSLMVVSTNTETGDTLLIGIPRNLEYVPIPDDNPLSTVWPNGYDCGDECLMNGIWTLAEDRRDLFPGVESPGRQSTIDVVGAITGLEIDHSVVINLRGFTSLVNAMGGVEINVQERVCTDCSSREDGSIRWTDGEERWIEPGIQRLDGHDALWYSRSRAGKDDFSRMRRQRCVAGALIDQADPVSLLRNYPQLAKVIKDNVDFDIPQDDLTAWVDLILRVQEGGSIRSLPLTNKVLSPADPDFDEIRRLVAKGLDPPPPATSSPQPTSSSTSTPTGSANPTPSATPDDADAADLSATC
jgi:LCP family protein required for cell wall assembly